VCNAENVHVLREFRANCKMLIALGACAVNGGLPAQRNHLDLPTCLQRSTAPATASPRGSQHPQRPGAAAAAEQGAPGPRGGEDRLLPARLPALGRRDLEVPDRPDRRQGRTPSLGHGLLHYD
jgi:NAD-reducing hydrogenase small subunit